MESVGVPYGDADVGCVESSFAGGDGDDVAVMDGVAEEGIVGDAGLGNVSELSASHGLFLLADGADERLLSLEHLIAVGVGGHVVDVEGLNGGERRIGRLQFIDESHLVVVFNPVGEIVEA